jgi:hypothetical protein
MSNIRKESLGTYTLPEYIHKFYGNYKTGFAKEMGVPPAQITKWIVKGYIVSNGVMYSARRKMPILGKPVKSKSICFDCRKRLGYVGRDNGSHTAVLQECGHCGDMKSILPERHWMKASDKHKKAM